MIQLETASKMGITQKIVVLRHNDLYYLSN